MSKVKGEMVGGVQSADYLTPAEHRDGYMHGLRVYLRGDDVVFVSKMDGNVERFLALCPKCGEAMWYEVGEIMSEKHRTCCWPAMEAFSGA